MTSHKEWQYYFKYSWININLLISLSMEMREFHYRWIQVHLNGKFGKRQRLTFKLNEIIWDVRRMFSSGMLPRIHLKAIDFAIFEELFLSTNLNSLSFLLAILLIGIFFLHLRKTVRKKSFFLWKADSLTSLISASCKKGSFFAVIKLRIKFKSKP